MIRHIRAPIGRKKKRQFQDLVISQNSGFKKFWMKTASDQSAAPENSVVFHHERFYGAPSSPKKFMEDKAVFLQKCGHVTKKRLVVIKRDELNLADYHKNIFQ